MLAIVAFFLVAGTFLDPGPALIFFVPMLPPVVNIIGIDPIQFAMVVVVLSLSRITPPVGVVMLVVGRIAPLDMWQLFRGIWPFLLAQAVVVLLLCLLSPPCPPGCRRR
jgi:TRAP-type C4-dicarboxylate transport system permease large subunit